MLQYAWYSVISPEGCAAILWRDASHAPQAAEALKLTAYDNMELEIIDKILEEPPGGAHNDPDLMAGRIKEEIISTLDELMPLPIDDLLKRRLEKFRRMGIFKG
jgi:acetyl-CoA carboxylase carboxyl transferase subunit alpha